MLAPPVQPSADGQESTVDRTCSSAAGTELGAPAIRSWALVVLESHRWDNGVQTFRADVLRRCDGAHEVSVSIAVQLAPASGDGQEPPQPKWYELSGPPHLLSLDQARLQVANEIESRLQSPLDLDFRVTSCSVVLGGGVRVWPDASLALDWLPVDMPLDVSFHRGAEVSTTTGRFIPDVLLSDGRGYGKLVVHAGPPDAERWPPPQRRWHARCRVRQ